VGRPFLRSPHPAPSEDPRKRIRRVEMADVARRKREIENQYGPWTAHNIQLRDDLYTIRPGLVGGSEVRLQQITQLIADVAQAPIDHLRVLDLGALEGLFAVEFARRGATVVAIEGREANLEKIRFAKEILGLDRLELRLEDVRELDRRQHGEFDVVLCLGLLYHLDSPDVFVLLERMREVCRYVTVIETRVHRYPTARREYRGKSYWGVVGDEPPRDTPPLSRTALWSSLGNPESFELTRASLCNALADVGYSSVAECHIPAYLTEEPRATFVAFTRPKQSILTVPALSERAGDRLPEAPTPLSVAFVRHPAYRFVRELIPKSVRRIVKRIGVGLTRSR
jgi:2-polyprenyl-3-methyl-5-hydroxy-6-metoxy-1,4-benzoquinol methylase